MTIAICTAATKSYLFAWPQFVRAVAASANHHAEAHFVFATDRSKESEAAEEVAKAELPSGWHIHAVRMDVDDREEKKYDQKAQLLIAMLQGAAFAVARAKVKADVCWSVESDTIPRANVLRVLEWALQMPDVGGGAYYDIAAASYWNGLFLGGFGTRKTPINDDFLPSERDLPARLKLCYDACEKRINDLAREKGPQQKFEKEMKRMARLRERIKAKPPSGTIWEVNAKHGWRRRGWFDFAYPGIGEGALVPVDWCGLGCTLMSKKALACADFCGYEGKGTQDLFLCWERWNPAGLRIACVPHALCDHVKRDGRETVVYRAHHERDGEFRGHLRCVRAPWIPV